MTQQKSLPSRGTTFPISAAQIKTLIQTMRCLGSSVLMADSPSYWMLMKHGSELYCLLLDLEVGMKLINVEEGTIKSWRHENYWKKINVLTILHKWMICCYVAGLFLKHLNKLQSTLTFLQELKTCLFPAGNFQNKSAVEKSQVVQSHLDKMYKQKHLCYP